MRVDGPIEQNNELKALLEENLSYAKQIYTSTEKTRRYIMWGQVLAFVKIILVVGPLILGFLYLQPYLKSVFGTYQDLLGGGLPSTSTPNSDSANNSGNILEQFKKLKDSGQLNELLK